MSVNLTINGQTFAYPETNDNDWGSSATLWATAVTSGMLQKAGGAFTLLADVNFGATFGLVSTYFKSRTADISTAGSLRLAQADSIGWRNNANSGNLLLSVSSDALLFNGVALTVAGSITNADISPTAAIDFSKLAALTSGNILVGNASNVATSVAMSGDVLISNAGVTSIGTGVIVNADVNASAAIAYSKLNLATSIVNADISGSAAIAYSKLNLATSIVNADINASAAIAGSKIAPQFGNQIVSGDREFQFTEIATPSTPASNKVLLYPKSDGNFYKMDDTGVEVAVGSGGGSGGGSLNIVDNPSAVSATTGWTAATNYTVSRDTSNSPLAGVIDSCFAISTTTASSEASTSGVYAASLANPSALRNTKLQLSMYVTVPASSLGVWRVSVYNSGGTRVSLSTDSSSVTTLPGGYTGQFAASFDADSGATYTLSITQTTRTSANTLYATNISIGNEAVLQGGVIGSPTSIVPTFTAFGTVASTDFKYIRVGTWMKLTGKVVAGTPTGSTASMSLPGFTVDTTAIPAKATLGTFADLRSASTTLYPNVMGMVFFNNDSGFISFSKNTASDAYVADAGTGVTATGRSMQIDCWIPIAEWAGSGTVNLGSNGVEYAYSTQAFDQTGTTTSYGPAGQVTANLAGTFKAKTITWLTPPQAGDQVTIEMSFDRVTWFDSALYAPYSQDNAGLNIYGVTITGSSGSTTNIQFNGYRIGAADGTPQADWGSSTYWRAKKISGGQAVGFGVVSENASGLMPSTLSNLDNATATRMGLKSYAHGTTYNGGAAPTITLSSGGGTLSSVTGSYFIPYQLQDLSWRMRFNVEVVLSSAARTEAVLAINGITFASAFNQVINANPSASVAPYSGLAIATAGQLASNHASTTTTTYRYSGDVALASKPTWAY